MPGLSGSQKAPLYSQFGTMRFGATRFGYHTARWFVSIGGTQRRGNVVQGTLVIEDALNEEPNRLLMTLVGLTPTKGQEVIVTLGSTNNVQRIFAGQIMSLRTRYDGRLDNIVRDVTASDYTYLLDRLVVLKKYTSTSATAIARDLIDTYTTGFTYQHIASGLETVDEMTFTDETVSGALTRLANRIGGYWYVDYRKDVHLWTGTESGFTNPTTITSSLVAPAFRDLVWDDDLTGVVTRVYVEGRGSRVVGAVAVAETKLPLDAVDMFDASVEFVKVSSQGSEGGAQRLTFTGVVDGGGGTLVGPGVTPTSAPGAIIASGAGVEVGVHLYAYTWVTASGETLPGPTVSVTSGFFDPPGALQFNSWIPGSLDENGWYGIAVTFVNASGETTPGARLAWKAGTDPLQDGLAYQAIPIGPSGTTSRKLYRTEGQASAAIAETAQLKFLATLADNSTTVYSDTIADASLGANAPTTNTAAAQQVDLSGIAVGPTGTTQRKVYRTVAGGAQLKLQSTIANNTATTLTDSTADGSLGANVPTTDTSGLAQTYGQANPGATTLTVSSTAPFLSAGGWAVIGNGQQVIRYTGVSGNTLTGIPASGIGAIVAAVTYGSTITASPMLTGIPASGTGSMTRALAKGDEAYLVVQRDDPTAQSTLAALIGGDGIQEDPIQDRRLSLTEATARGDAWLALKSAATISARYRTRDKNAASGRTITITSVNGLTGTLRIQRARWTEFSEAATRYPTIEVEASNTKFSLQDLLRQVRRQVEGTPS